VLSSSSAIGPCFISPAEYASVGMYEISFSFSALERHRQADVAAEVEEERLVEVVLGDLSIVVAVEERLDLLR
jgi:hypothetical protein